MFPVITLSQQAALRQSLAILFGILPFLIASLTIRIGVFQPVARIDSQWRHNLLWEWEWESARHHKIEGHRNRKLGRYDRCLRFPRQWVIGCVSRRKFSADAIRTSGGPARMLQWVPILLEHIARAEFLCQSDHFACGLRGFRSGGGSGICRCNVTMCACRRSPRSSARAMAARPSSFASNSIGTPYRLLRSRLSSSIGRGRYF
jgi:hypothetical protein